MVRLAIAAKQPRFSAATFVFNNSPAAVIKIKADGDLCALGDRPQGVDVQMKHTVLNDVPYLREAIITKTYTIWRH